tara:strand:+ start:217 stop:510 length:294 start_codon:yes stop_codon:yes gene_type:complete
LYNLRTYNQLKTFIGEKSHNIGLWKRLDVLGSATALRAGSNTPQSFGKGALKHFHSHLKDPRCVGSIKQTLLDYAKKNGMMALMKKRGYIRTQVVVA